jgi:hypothetical protein
VARHPSWFAPRTHPLEQIVQQLTEIITAVPFPTRQ